MVDKLAIPSREPPNWHEIIRFLRECSGLSQVAWADLLGVSKATVQRWEQGKSTPNAEFEDAILELCRKGRLLRKFYIGSLQVVDATESSFREALREARSAQMERKRKRERGNQ